MFNMRSDGQDSIGYVMSASEFDYFAAGSTFYPLVEKELEKNTWYYGSYTPTSANYYAYVVFNDSTLFDEEVNFTHEMTRADNIWDYYQMIYGALQDQGFNYVSVAGNFFEGSQQIVLPEEVLSSSGGNCIDGTLLFAAVLENMGVRPIVQIVPGHAFLSTETGPTSMGATWELETTLVGNSSTDWFDAVEAGTSRLAETDPADIISVYIDEARANGLTPMP